MRRTIAYECCKFHKNRFNSKKVMAVSCPYVTMFVDRKFSASVSTGARGGRRQHRGELTGAGGTLDGVSSPHSAFSKVAGKVFQFSTDLDQTWYTYWESQKGTAHQLWRKSDTSKWPSAVKGKNDQEELSRWWPNLQDICIDVLYTFPENLKRIQLKMRKL